MGIRELRNTLTAAMRRVDAGETIEITRHGEPVAVLAPARGDRIQQLLQAGDITSGKWPPRRFRRYAPAGALTASEALEEDRAER